MALDLTTLPQADVQRNLAIIKTYINETNPTVATDSGPFNDLLVYYAALFTTANQKAVSDAISNIHVSRLLTAPTSISSADADSICANFGIRRQQSTCATGQICITTDKPVGFVIPAGSQFTARDIVFSTKGACRVAGGAHTNVSRDKQLTPTTDGKWVCVIDVTAKKAGAIGNLRKNETLTALDPKLAVYATCAANDFIGGADAEDNTKLRDRLHAFLAGTHCGGRSSYAALIYKCISATAVSVIGFGDPEMLRDRSLLWPGGCGGCVDIYIKSLKWDPTGDINTAQVYINRPDIKPPGTSVLVKPAVRFGVTIHVTLLNLGTAPINTDGIKYALSEACNNTGFTGQLYVNTLMAAITTKLPTSALIKNITVAGDISHNGEAIICPPCSILTVPNRPEIGISRNTTAFFTNSVVVDVTS